MSDELGYLRPSVPQDLKYLVLIQSLLFSLGFFKIHNYTVSYDQLSSEILNICSRTHDLYA